MYKTILPVIPPTSPAPAQTYSYLITMEVHMKYALVILRYGNVFAHPRFRETFSDPGGSLITRDLSIALPVPSRTHVLLYSRYTTTNSFRHDPSAIPYYTTRSSRVPRSPVHLPPGSLRFPVRIYTISLYPCATALLPYSYYPVLVYLVVPDITSPTSFPWFTTFSALVSRAASQQHP